MALPITIAQIQSLLNPGLFAVESDTNTLGDQWRGIFQEHKSEKAVEYTTEMQLLGPAGYKAEAGPIPYGTMQEWVRNSFVHKYYGIGFIITRQTLKDNLYKDKFPKAMAALKDSHRQVKNQLAMSVFNNGFNSSFPLGDGQSFFSTAHPVATGTVSNTSGVITQLSEVALQDAAIQVQYFQAASGLRTAYRPNMLVVPPYLQFTVDRILGSKYQTQTGNNDINAIVNMGMFPGGYKVNQFLTSPYNWFVLTDQKTGLKYFEREPLEVNMFPDINTWNINVTSLTRYSFGCDNFRAAVGYQGA